VEIKPEDLVVGAELVCTKSNSKLYEVGGVYKVASAEKSISVVRLTSDKSLGDIWSIDCIRRIGKKYKDWDVQFKLKQNKYATSLKHSQKDISMLITKTERLTALVDRTTTYKVSSTIWDELTDFRGHTTEQSLAYAISSGDCTALMSTDEVLEVIVEHDSTIEEH
jgi:hypothetical protein